MGVTLPGTGEAVAAATKESSFEYQIMLRGGDRRSDTFTAAAQNGTTVNLIAVDGEHRIAKKFALQVKGNGGTPTEWHIVLEGSLDGTTFSPILEHTHAGNALGDTIWQPANVETPCTHFRSRCVAVTLSGATNIEAIILGVG